MKPRIYILLSCIVVCTIFLAAMWFLSKESLHQFLQSEVKIKANIFFTEQNKFLGKMLRPLSSIMERYTFFTMKRL